MQRPGLAVRRAYFLVNRERVARVVDRLGVVAFFVGYPGQEYFGVAAKAAQLAPLGQADGGLGVFLGVVEMACRLVDRRQLQRGLDAGLGVVELVGPLERRLRLGARLFGPAE